MVCLFVKIVILFLINHLKLLLIVVKKDLLIDDQIFPIVKVVKNLFMYNISSLQPINALQQLVFFFSK